VTATSARPVVFEGGISHAISHQRRREGRSPAVLEAPRKELIQQRQRSPAAYPASARGRRRLCGLLVSNPSSRSPVVWQFPAARCGGTRSFCARCELSSLHRRRKRLPNHHSSRGRRLPAAGRRPRASISLQRSLSIGGNVGDVAKRLFSVGMARENASSHTDSRPQINLGSKSI